MSRWLMRRARAARLFGAALAFAGLVPVLAFTVGSLLPAAEASAMLGFFPEVPWLAGVEKWLHARRVRWSPPTGLLYALPGLALMFLGAWIAKSQHATLDAARARKADARRRRAQYGASERIEPTLF